MKTILIIASILAALWVLRFIIHFIASVEMSCDPEDLTQVRFKIGTQYFCGKILTWKIFWVLIIRMTKWHIQLLILLTGAPVWGFVLYLIIESMIIVGKRFYKWLNWQ